MGNVIVPNERHEEENRKETVVAVEAKKGLHCFIVEKSSMVSKE